MALMTRSCSMLGASCATGNEALADWIIAHRVRASVSVVCDRKLIGTISGRRPTARSLDLSQKQICIEGQRYPFLVCGIKGIPCIGTENTGANSRSVTFRRSYSPWHHFCALRLFLSSISSPGVHLVRHFICCLYRLMLADIQSNP